MVRLTTDRNDPDLVRGIDTEPRPQADVYLFGHGMGVGLDRNTGADHADAIDWARFFNHPVRQAHRCACGREWRSHGRVQPIDGKFRMVTRDPCPNCGCHHFIVNSVTDPETMWFRR